VSHTLRRGRALAEPRGVAELQPALYEGIVTRALAFAVDAAVINLVAIAVAAIVALILSVLSLPDALDTTIVATSGAAFLLWLIGYFVVFWSATGQTPGNRLLQIRVCRARDGAPPSPRAALFRLAGLALAALPLFLGFLPVLLDDRRRGLHDMLAGTVVTSAISVLGEDGRARHGAAA
jgi:uncharacterized RDD family membrane protein YckC